jgi:hypothetical protein
MSGCNNANCVDTCGNVVDCDDFTMCSCVSTSSPCYNPDGSLSAGCTAFITGSPNPVTTGVGSIQCSNSIGNLATGCTGATTPGCNYDSNGNLLGCPGSTSIGGPGTSVSSGGSTTIGGTNAVGGVGGFLSGIGSLIGGVLKGTGLVAGQPTAVTPAVATSPLSSPGVWLVLAVVAGLIAYEVHKKGGL